MDQKYLLDVINHWCPQSPTFDREPTDVRLVRALLAANACVLCHNEALAGKEPVIPVSFFPKGHQ